MTRQTDAEAALKSHWWPGGWNILSNILRTPALVADDAAVVIASEAAYRTANNLVEAPTGNLETVLNSLRTSGYLNASTLSAYNALRTLVPSVPAVSSTTYVTVADGTLCLPEFRHGPEAVNVPRSGGSNACPFAVELGISNTGCPGIEGDIHYKPGGIVVPAEGDHLTVYDSTGVVVWEGPVDPENLPMAYFVFEHSVSLTS